MSEQPFDEDAAKALLAQYLYGSNWASLHRGDVHVDPTEIPPGTEVYARDPLMKGQVRLVVDEVGAVKVRSITSRVGQEQEPPRISEPSPAVVHTPGSSPDDQVRGQTTADTSMSQEMPMSNSVQARFYVASLDLQPNDIARVTMKAVCRGPENRDWSKYTPSGEFWMNLNGGGAEEWFRAHRGKELKITIEERDPICDNCHKEVPAAAFGGAYKPEVHGYSDYDETGAARFVCAECKAERDATAAPAS